MLCVCLHALVAVYVCCVSACTSCCVRVRVLCVYSQGVESTADREISCTVSVEQLPDIMRAIGYYPSDEEVSGRSGYACAVCD